MGWLQFAAMKKTFRQLSLIAGFILTTQNLNAQQNNSSGNTDSSNIKNLPDITVVGRHSNSDYQQMPEIVGTNIYAGKKGAVVVMDHVQGNVVTNTMRQVLSKIPGIHIWESDPSGIQVGIAARGLSPNRSWEFNIRQNGYDIAADPYGYPEAYYNPPMQAVQRIEVVRGQGSLQYGPQFGGMVNYILKNGAEINKPFEIESQQTFGSYGLFNSYNAIGGKKGKLQYYGFFDHRNGNGWRPNSRYNTNAGFGTVTWFINNKFSLSAELMRSHIRSQQPGGLTDKQFEQDAGQSFRARNWFDITWTTPAIILNYQIDAQTRWNTKLFATIGDRSSVGFLQPITVMDSINASTLQYNPRTVNIDQYRNLGLESRLLTAFKLGSQVQNFSAGIRLYTGRTDRRTEGKGTTGSEYDVSVSGNYPKDIRFTSSNAAIFAEQLFRIGKQLLIVPGIRYEWLSGSASGRNGYSSTGEEVLLQNVTRSRGFVLGGIGFEYHLGKHSEFYANITQAYRPIQFANLQAPPGTDVIDPELKDARGYNADFGVRGNLGGKLRYDMSFFYLKYDNRIGTIIPDSANYRLVSNVGSSINKGFEGFIEWNASSMISKNKHTIFLLFATYGYTDARYSSDHKIANTKGKQVENAPKHILRGGISGGYQQMLLTLQVSYTGKTFSDANNTEVPSANAQAGEIPEYLITDLTGSFPLNKNVLIKAGINNLFDKKYFTRRAGGYPGPGLLPGDSRNFFLTFGIML